MALIPGVTRVRWTTPDLERAREEIERRRAEYRAESTLQRALRGAIAERELLPEFVVHHTGTILALAFQPESYAVSTSERHPNIERHVKPRWTALVARDDGVIVELNPTMLTVELAPSERVSE